MAEGRVQRRLAAILAADVVGYSRLMGEDEEATLATLKAFRDVIDGLVAGHQGRVFGSAGDSVIAEFASPVEAVRCATEIQLEIDRRNADLGDERRMRTGRSAAKSAQQTQEIAMQCQCPDHDQSHPRQPNVLAFSAS